MGWSQALLAEQIEDSLAGEPGFYAWLTAELDFANRKPAARPGVVISAQTNQNGPVYILRSPSQRYLQLNERDYFIWQQLDGQHTVRQIALAYFEKFSSIGGFNRLQNLLEQLRLAGCLAEDQFNLYQELNLALAHTPWFKRLGQKLLFSNFVIHGLDKWLDRLYGGVGRAFFVSWGILAWLVLGLAGLGAFGSIALSGRYQLFSPARETALSLVCLLFGYYLAALLHELAHGLTAKHFAASVPEGGLLLFGGIPAFYINTCDMALRPKRARLLVSLAGPVCNALLGGLAALLALTNGPGGFSLWFYPLAYSCYTSALLNFNPILSLDGYYLVADWLEIPHLRQRALRFVTYMLWSKFARRQSLSSEEKKLALFGISTLAGLGVLVIYLLWSLQTQLTGWLGAAIEKHDLISKFVFGFYTFLAAFPIVMMLVLAGFNLGRKIWPIVRKWENQASPSILWWGGQLAIAGLTGLVYSLDFRLGLTISLFGLIGIFWGSRIFLGLSFPVLNGLVIAISSVGLLQLSWLWEPAAGRFIGIALVELSLLRLVSQLRLTPTSPAQTRWQTGLTGLTLLAAQWPWLGGGSQPLFLQLLAGVEIGAVGLLLAALVPVLAQQSHSPLYYGHLSLALGAFGLFGLGQGPAELAGLVVGWLAGELALAFWLYARAYHRNLARPAPLKMRPAATDRERLQLATYHLIQTILHSLEFTLGLGLAGKVRDALNAASLVAGWQLQVKPDNQLVSLETKDQLSLNEMGRNLSQALEQTLGKIIEAGGSGLARLALQRGYDSLQWEERELVQDYLLKNSAYQSWFDQEKAAGLESLLKLLGSIPLFLDSNRAELEELSRVCRVRRYRVNLDIIRQGTVGQHFYIVRQGVVGVYQNGKLVNQHGPGAYFGELALLHKTRRNATCKALTDSEVLVIARRDFQRLAARYFNLPGKLAELYQHVQLLRQNPLFAELEFEQLGALAQQATLAEYAPAEIICEQGTTGDQLYIIEEGWLEVLDQAYTVLERRGPGEVVGERAVWLDVPRSATLRAATSCRLLVLHKSQLKALLAGNNLIQQAFERLATRRLINMQKFTEGRFET
jgi:putative peptide zinc metalloprotease protein